MLDCIDCTTLEARATDAAKRNNGLLLEVERLRENLATIQRRLDAEASQRRHWIRIACDRCGAVLEIASSLTMPDGQRCTAMRRAAIALGWRLGTTTHGALGGDGQWFGSDRDLCQCCGDALNLAPPIEI